MNIQPAIWWLQPPPWKTLNNKILMVFRMCQELISSLKKYIKTKGLICLPVLNLGKLKNLH
mgnify:CR=1 FL=1